MRYDWTITELRALYDLPLFALISKAHHLHVQFHTSGYIQVCNLISIKTGGCPEDCKYCAQSSRYQTAVAAQPMMQRPQVLQLAKEAIARGATRICLGAAWRSVRDGKQFDEVLAMIKAVAELDVEVCCTLGMLTEPQAERLKSAGLYAYNHNLDSSEQFYKTIITTRTYQDRLRTLDVVGKTGLKVCCGGIVGMGETVEDRLQLLLTLATLKPHPESVPINQLSAVAGTPLEGQSAVSAWDVLRIIAVARCVLPKSMIRLSCGRIAMSYEQQALSFFAGANSIFIGEKLLTVANTSPDHDEAMFQLLGLTKNDSIS